VASDGKISTAQKLVPHLIWWKLQQFSDFSRNVGDTWMHTDTYLPSSQTQFLGAYASLLMQERS
jgi:hypothetical protein